MNVSLAPARYYAGINRPFFVSDGMIRSKLAEYGITLIAISPRASLPASVKPTSDSLYSDDWDEFVVCEYRGKPKTIDVARNWKWLMRAPLTEPAKPVPAITLPAASSSPVPSALPMPPQSGVALALLAIGAYLFARR